eukprot:363446-Chlamydomonas_euryale.AAC.2
MCTSASSHALPDGRADASAACPFRDARARTAQAVFVSWRSPVRGDARGREQAQQRRGGGERCRRRHCVIVLFAARPCAKRLDLHRRRWRRVGANAARPSRRCDAITTAPAAMAIATLLERAT